MPSDQNRLPGRGCHKRHSLFYSKTGLLNNMSYRQISAALGIHWTWVEQIVKGATASVLLRLFTQETVTIPLQGQQHDKCIDAVEQD